MNRPYPGNGIWKDKWVWGSSCEKEKNGEELREVMDTGVPGAGLTFQRHRKLPGRAWDSLEAKQKPH